MAEAIQKGKFIRLEDFIVIAGQGKDVQLEIELQKQPVKQKTHPEETEDMKDEIDMYLLMADYNFRFEGQVIKIPKVYVFGSVGESMSASKMEKNIANERLKMDYKRLKAAHIIFEEKYF